MHFLTIVIVIFAIHSCDGGGFFNYYSDDTGSDTAELTQQMEMLQGEVSELSGLLAALSEHANALETELNETKSTLESVSNLHSLTMTRINQTVLQENDTLTFEILTYGDGTDVSPPDDSYLYNASWNAYVVPSDGQYRFGLLVGIAATFLDGDFGFFVRDPEGTETHLSEYDFKISPFVPERSTQRAILNLFLKAESRVFVKEISAGCTVEYAVFACCREGDP